MNFMDTEKHTKRHDDFWDRESQLRKVIHPEIREGRRLSYLTIFQFVDNFQE
jgi:hypothetical protein